MRVSEPALRKKRQKLDGESALLTLQKNSLRLLVHHSRVDAPNYYVRLHHRVFESESLLSVPTSFDQYVPSLVRREAAQVFFEMSNSLPILHDGAERLNDFIC